MCIYIYIYAYVCIIQMYTHTKREKREGECNRVTESDVCSLHHASAT